MRRNVTLSLSDEFIARVDESRGSVPRSRWLESLLSGKQVPVAPPVVERSPEPEPDSEPPREPSPGMEPTDRPSGKAERLEAGRRLLSKPVQPRPIIQKRS